MNIVSESALKALATQLFSSRRRLANRMENRKPPSVPQMAVALRFYLQHRDDLRAAAVHPASTHIKDEAFKSVKEKMRLRQLVNLAKLAYGTRKDLDEVARTEPRFRVVCSRHASEIWEPAYYLAHFPDSRELVLVIRGTRDVADVFTDTSVEIDEFLGSYGHRGVVRSARWLLGKLLPTLNAAVDAGEVDRVIITGHSLGASVAAAATLMLRCDSGDIGEIPEVLNNATCVALGPPPFLSEELSESTAEMGVITVVNGLDIVPRLSYAALDRFFLEIARFDWSSALCQATERATRSLIKAEELANLGKVVTNAFTPLSSVVAKKASNLNGKQDVQSGAVLARNLGIVVDEEDPPEMYLPGRIVHLDIPFVHPDVLAEDVPVLRPTFKLASRNAFKDIDASGHMVNHHMLVVLREQLDLMIEEDIEKT